MKSVLQKIKNTETYVFVKKVFWKVKMECPVPMIVVHGGAGDIPDSRVKGKLDGVIAAVKRGRHILAMGGTAIDACVEAVMEMEEDGNFNAGYGSVLTSEGKIQMEASIMDGSTLNSGAVTLLDDVKHPIAAARKVMRDSFHTLLGADGAKKFLDQYKEIERVDPSSLVTDWAKRALAADKMAALAERTEIGDTVGAVAVDCMGNVAAATSTGGMSGKQHGRIGDTPIIGSGTYADNLSGAVSTTGHGEAIMKYCMAVRTCDQMLQGAHPINASTKVLNDMTDRFQKTAGLISVMKGGHYAAVFNTPRMAWACARTHQVMIEYGIEQGEMRIYSEVVTGDDTINIPRKHI